MAWKYTIACPKCKYFGFRRHETPCDKCWKRSTLAKPTKFLKRPRRPKK